MLMSCVQCSKSILKMIHSKRKFCNLACSNACLAIEAASKANTKRYDAYLENTPKCAECESDIPYDSKGEFKRKKFCSRSCSATYTNKTHPKRIISENKLKKKTLIAEKKQQRIDANRTPRPKPIVNYVSKTLSPQQASDIIQRRTQAYVTQFLEGKLKYRLRIRIALIALYGYRCSCCSTSEWEGEPVPLHVDHKNGDASDNSPENLRLLCPNCHAQTPTHKAKNKGKGRGSRGLSLG